MKEGETIAMAIQCHPVVLRSPNLGISLMPLFLSLPHIHPLCVRPNFRICPDLNPPPTPAATTLLGAAVRAHLTAAKATPLGFLHPPSPFILSQRDPGKTSVRSYPSCSEPSRDFSLSGKKSKPSQGSGRFHPCLSP